MATSESYADKNTNKKVDKTKWYSVVLFNLQKFGKICSSVQNSPFFRMNERNGFFYGQRYKGCNQHFQETTNQKT